MGAGESSNRRVSFELDEEEKVRVLHGVKLTENVLDRMREPRQTSPEVHPPPPSESRQPDSGSSPGPTAAEKQEELRKRFERDQALVQDQLARLAQREKETRANQDDLGFALLKERVKTHEELDKSQQLARKLDKKEAELKHLAAFYKEQLHLLEKKNMDFYKDTAAQYNEAATKTEAHVTPRPTTSVCSEFQAQILQCYQENRHQTLQCSHLAKQYMQCIQNAKKNLLVNHG